MDPKQQILVSLLKDIRWQISTHLPIGHSYIPQDIIFKVLDGYFDRRDLSVKILFAELPYSVMGTRLHFNKLIATNWIESLKSEKDARVKIVLPSTKLLKRLNLLTNNLEQTFYEHQNKSNLIQIVNSSEIQATKGFGDSKV